VMDMWQSRKVSEVREGRRCVRKGKEGWLKFYSNWRVCIIPPDLIPYNIIEEAPICWAHQPYPIIYQYLNTLTYPINTISKLKLKWINSSYLIMDRIYSTLL
jgi:hypothetical protein